MVWKTTNYKGEPVTWYSQESMDKAMKMFDDACKRRDETELYFENKRKALKKELLFINTEIAKCANDGVTHRILKTALLSLNHSLSDIIREL
ncbi:MAG: hypothetical protein IJ681_00355 [Bacteroidales bacterium]|nr:hypothetical protein [Bacteroidales bacterium]